MQYSVSSVWIISCLVGEPEPEPLEEKKQEPETLGKKSGAGAAKKLAGSPGLLEDKKHKEIVLSLLLFR